jgi:tRNA nucleotidyltransferase/poly(A) polymerase
MKVNKDIISTLNKLSFIDNLYAVGGCVRDTIMGIPPRDIDLTSSLTPSEFIRICNANGYSTVATGERFGTVTVFIDDEKYEHTTFRSDHNQDGRHCEVKYVSTIEEDLGRRDFTINAMAMSRDADIIDPYNGVTDIYTKHIRTVGSVYDRFGEDRLRILRACRFAGRFEFSLSLAIRSYIHDHAIEVMDISAERIKQEFDKAFEDDKPGMFLIILQRTGLMGYILPEIYVLESYDQNPIYHPEGNVFNHLLQINNTNKKYRWEYFLHDVGKGVTAELSDAHPDYYSFHGHEGKGLSLIDIIAHRLKFSNDLKISCKVACQYHMQAHQVAEASTDKAIRKFQNKVGKDYLEMLKEVCRVDCLGRNSSFDPNIFKSLPDEVVFKPAVTGKFLIAKGFTEGKIIGMWKRKCFNVQLEQGLIDPEEIYKIVMHDSDSIVTVKDI